MPAKGAKLLLIALYLACDYQAVGARVAELGPSPLLAVYLLMYGTLAAGLAAAAFIPVTVVRLGVAAVLASSSVMLHGYEWATGTPLDYNAFETMLASTGDAGDAARQHPDVLMAALGAALLLFLAVALPARGRVLPFRLHWWAPGCALLGLSAMLYARGGEGARALPAPFIPLAEATIKGTLWLTDEDGPRKPVAIRPAGPRPVEDIVLIVDESVAAKYLDLGDPSGVRSGLTQDRAGFLIANYGIAASVTNCSAGSNRSLRYGGTRESYRLAGKVQPSVWAYAHAAGMRTVYLDGQRNGGELHNLMTAQEKAEIDRFVQLDGVSVIERDHRLADMLVEHIGNGTPEFIYVNKIGGHFPVADKYPDAFARYRPALARDGSAEIADMGMWRGSHRGTPDEWRLYRNSYRNTLLWNVGDFFDSLLSRIDPAKAVILYTSDHGQDLHERGNPGKATHCLADPSPEEGAVPLVAIDSAAQPRLDWRASLAGNRDGMSHFRVFPTLLELMGYARHDVAALYGPPLTAPDKDPMTFTINYFAALGREPTWRRVDPPRLAGPPATDGSPALAGGAAGQPKLW